MSENITDSTNDIITLNMDDVQAFAEFLRGLPEDYRKTLHGAAVGLKMAADIDNRKTMSPMAPVGAMQVV